MKKGLLFSIGFLVFALSGCGTASGIQPQPQGYATTGAPAERLGYGNIGRMEQPGTGNTASQPEYGGSGGTVQQGYGSSGNAEQQGYNPGTAGQTEEVRRMGSTARLAGIGLPGAISDSDAGITVQGVRSPVRQGDNGSLSIQGAPDTNYTVTATYNNSRGTVTASSTGLTDAGGRLTWVWYVKRDTIPGTYRLVVSGGGKMITSSYTVTR